jgi:aromatic ring hydroxylase
MIRTGQQCLDSIRDNCEVHINGERVKDVEIGGVVTRVGDETVGEMWSLKDQADNTGSANGAGAAA